MDDEVKLAEELEQLPIATSLDGKHDLRWLTQSLFDRLIAALSRPSNPDAVKLAEAVREYVAEHDKDIWCQRIKYGHCSLRKCNIEGGWAPNDPPDYSKATCSRYRLECALRQLYPAPDVERVAKKCNHDWYYTGTDYHGSHKGEDCYHCAKCRAWKYELNGHVTSLVEPPVKRPEPQDSLADEATTADLTRQLAEVREALVNALLDLAARCEATEGPDRELDCEIAKTLHPNSRFTSEDEGFAGLLDLESNTFIPLPAYTASLDAALTLVPSELEWELMGYDAARDPRFGRFQARIMLLTYAEDPEELGPQAIANAATPALALCAAALRARARNHSEDNATHVEGEK